jgi:hypothetical protein
MLREIGLAESNLANQLAGCHFLVLHCIKNLQSLGMGKNLADISVEFKDIFHLFLPNQF